MKTISLPGVPILPAFAAARIAEENVTHQSSEEDDDNHDDAGVSQLTPF